jgi:hypothetical protein
VITGARCAPRFVTDRVLDVTLSVKRLLLCVFVPVPSVPASLKGTKKKREIHPRGTPLEAPSEVAYRVPLELCLNSTRRPFRAGAGLTLPKAGSVRERTADEVDILCVDDREVDEDDGSGGGSGGAGAGAGSVGASAGHTKYYMVELVAHERLGSEDRSTSVKGHFERMEAYVQRTSEVLGVDRADTVGWLVNFELEGRSADVDLVAVGEGGPMHVMHVFHSEDAVVTKVVYWSPASGVLTVFEGDKLEV